ncbi:matrixin family metalloprotease [Haloferax sp. S1W]|uniref:matrixin family metalloprotease n=1 Tax=Haloferax sp. S1W TaxID=3377110 RepID=UPI0037C5BAD3
MRRFSLVVALLVVFAGCTAPAIPENGTTTPSSHPTSGESTPVRTTSPMTTPSSATTTAEPTPASGFGPWGDDPVVIAVEGPSDGRDYAPLVREATDFWETNDGKYLGYEVEFEVVPNADNPDIVVQFSESIPDCGDQSDAVGCAPYVTDARQIDRPETIYIKTGFSDDSTVEIIEHEFGHSLGLAHGDEPDELMNATGILYTLPLTNATEKAFPWDDANFTVYIDESGAKNPEKAREQVQHALDYYEAGAPGMPDNISFTRVENPEDAEIRISFSDTSPCAEDAASCSSVSGYDPDGDRALETYDHFRVVLVDLDTDAVGWHVGYWMAHYFGAEDDADKPDPFQNASYSDRRSEWWEE